MKPMFLAVSLLAAGTAAAQPAPANPLDPRAPVPALQHRSAFEGYVPDGEGRPVDWRAANETVARSAAKSATPASEPQKPVPAQKPMPMHHRHGHGHGGHR